MASLWGAWVVVLLSRMTRMPMAATAPNRTKWLARPKNPNSTQRFSVLLWASST